MKSRPFFTTNPLIFRIAKVSRRAAKVAIFLRAVCRQPRSREKRILFRDRANVLLDNELHFEKWVHPKRVESDDWAIRYPQAIPIEAAAGTQPLRVAVVCHLYYVDLIDEIRGILASLPTGFDLLVSTDTKEKKSQIEEGLSSSGASRTVVREFPNVGRDIAAKLICFKDMLGQYDVILFIHGKKSEFASKLSGWRNHLFDTLIGSPDRVKSILASFADIADLGIIAPPHYDPLGSVGWRENLEISDDLCSKLLGARYAFNFLDFPSGSMFWCRPAALQPLLDLNLTVKDFPAEEGQIDGTLAHAIERFFFVSCEIAGFRWVKLAGQPSPASAPHVVGIASTSDLRRALQRPGGRVIAQR